MLDFLMLRLVHYFLALGTLFSQWMPNILKPPGLTFGKASSLAIESDAQKLKKFPIHMGVLFLENDISFADIANIVTWCMVLGIQYISLYDMDGQVKRNRKILENFIQMKKKEILNRDSSKYCVHIESAREIDIRDAKISNSSNKLLTVSLLSVEDGRQSIIHTCRHICKSVLDKQLQKEDIVPYKVDNLFKEAYHLPDPDMVLKFGSVESLLGFMPWQLRLTEIMSLPTHKGITYKTFMSKLFQYGNTEQRCGK